MHSIDFTLEVFLSQGVPHFLTESMRCKLEHFQSGHLGGTEGLMKDYFGYNEDAMLLELNPYKGFIFRTIAL